MSDADKQEARKILEERFGMSLEKLPVHQQPSAYAEMREMACKAKLAAAEAALSGSQKERNALKDLIARQSELQTALQEQFNAARTLTETVVKMDADKAQLQATICTLRSVLEELIDGIESGGGCDGNGDVFDLGPAIAALNEAKP